MVYNRLSLYMYTLNKSDLNKIELVFFLINPLAFFPKHNWQNPSFGIVELNYLTIVSREHYLVDCFHMKIMIPPYDYLTSNGHLLGFPLTPYLRRLPFKEETEILARELCLSTPRSICLPTPEPSSYSQDVLSKAILSTPSLAVSLARNDILFQLH